MNTLILACPEISANGGELTVVNVIPCPDGSGTVPPPDTVSGPVIIVPQVLYQDNAILIVKRIDDSFRRATFNFYLRSVDIPVLYIWISYINLQRNYVGLNKADRVYWLITR